MMWINGQKAREEFEPFESMPPASFRGADCAERPPVPPELLGRVLLSCAFDAPWTELKTGHLGFFTNSGKFPRQNLGIFINSGPPAKSDKSRILGVPSPFFPGILLFRHLPETQGKRLDLAKNDGSIKKIGNQAKNEF